MYINVAPFSELEADVKLNILSIGFVCTSEGHSVIPLVVRTLEVIEGSDASYLEDLICLDTLVSLLLANATENCLCVPIGDFVITVFEVVAATLDPLLVHGLGSFSSDKEVIGDLDELKAPAGFELVEPRGVTAIQEMHIANVFGVLAEPDDILVAVLAFTEGALALHHQCIPAAILPE